MACSRFLTIPSALKFLLSFLAMCFVSGVALGQMVGPPPPTHIVTLDLTIANSPTVVVGTITLFVDPTMSGALSREVVIRVQDTLNGPHIRDLRVWLQAPSDVMAGWKKNADRLLIAKPAGSNAICSVIDLSAENLAVMTADLKLLRRPDEVLAAARAEIHRVQPPAAGKRFSIPMPVAKIAGTPLAAQVAKRSALLIDVPSDSRLENWGRSETLSSDPSTRILGIQALGIFASDRDVPLLKRLLEDPGWQDSYSGFNERNKVLHTRTNYVRREAFTALKSMKVSVPEPVSFLPPNHDDQVEYVEALSTDLVYPNISDLYRYPHLQSIRFANGSANLLVLNRLETLKAVSLDNTGTPDIQLQFLSQLPALEYLGLDDTPITDTGLLELANLKSLKTVDVGSHVTDEGIQKLRRMRPDLLVRRDLYAFLEPFHPRRVDQPLQVFTENIISSEDPTGTRSYALVIPKEYADKLDETLKKELLPRGYNHQYFGFEAPRSIGGAVYTEFKPEWLAGVLADPGDRILVISKRVY